jgi:uncharacterized protein
MDPLVPFRQFVVKVHSRCDLACDHCYMYEHADQSWRGRPAVMSCDTAARTGARIAEHMAAHALDEVNVVLHGGEPLLAGPSHLDAVIRVLRSAVEGVGRLELTVQTNGVLLDERFCAVFREHGVRVGFSLDGDRVANDRHRRYANGRSSHAQVLAAIELARREIPELYIGLLCTIDVANDPIAVYEALTALGPPAIEFLLPHATWDHPPARPTGTAYADWLSAIFDRWLEDGAMPPVRTFDSIVRTLHGAGSLTESLGLVPSDLVVVETDGTLEQADSLKTAFDGAPATGFDVTAHTFDEVAAHPGIVARQSGIDGLCTTCRECPVLESCGGGLYAHRYRTGSGFDNPSVYCADLMALIGHVREAVKPPVHTMPADGLDALAAGYGGPAEIERLAGSQLTITRALIASIPRQASAWDLLSRADEQAPDQVDAVLAHPYVRAWAVACVRGEADPDRLAAVAAAAAARARLDAELAVPVLDGWVPLPTLGCWEVDRTGSTTIRIRQGKVMIDGEIGYRPVPTLETGDVTVALEDTDPYRDCHEWPAAPPLDEDEILAWRERFDEAWRLIERDHPAYAPGLAAGLSTIVPLRPAAPGGDVSSTARHAFGAVAIALPADPATLALLLIHEYQHVKLGAVLDLFDLYDSDDTDLYYAPWRDDPRPLEGLLQGTYAHIAVADFWRARRLADPGDEAAAAFARWRWQTAEAIDTLAASGSLTPLGERFAAGMRATVRPWLDEPVPDAARSAAERSARRHREAWSAAKGSNDDPHP